jgi:hypothetical protein
VRQRFRDAGSPYNGELVDRHLEAYLYMLPLELEGDPVPWWVD